MSARDRERDILDLMYSSTEGEKWQNEHFRLNTMRFNAHGPGLVSRNKLMDSLITLAEDKNKEEGWDDPNDAKFLTFLKGVSNKAKFVLSAAGSIDGATLETLLTHKGTVRTILNKEAASSGFLGFGSGGNQHNAEVFR